jgi:glycerol-3-phosphate cytidylyltransferase
MVGYTTGVFDLFHIGHLNILRNAKSMCDKLIVGVSTDELVKEKGKKALVPFSERIEIVRAIKYVDVAIPQTTVDKNKEWEKLKFDILFVGDDWFGKWKFKNLKIVYFPYTEGVSSTLRRARL